jgi:hypothetical protein
MSADGTWGGALPCTSSGHAYYGPAHRAPPVRVSHASVWVSGDGASCRTGDGPPPCGASCRRAPYDAEYRFAAAPSISRSAWDCTHPPQHHRFPYPYPSTAHTARARYLAPRHQI